MSDAKWPTRRTGCIIAIVVPLLFWTALYVAGRYLPWDTTGEGPWPENFR